MDIFEATTAYESWLRTVTEVDSEALQVKHKAMCDGAFRFLRAAYYDWIALWQSMPAEIKAAPVCPSIGDIHIENFGTWRDAEGRLIWGINDYDEATELPYTNDLVRLATSVLLAIEDDRLEMKPRESCEAILSGYTRGLERGAKVFVLAEDNDWLRDIARRQIKDPGKFFRSMESLPDAAPPARVIEILKGILPEPFRVKKRIAGLGSLGRQRYAAIAEVAGSRIVREVKANCPPSQNAFGSVAESLRARILENRPTSPDPFLLDASDYTVRRLAPDCTKIEISLIGKTSDQIRLLASMGREISNVHCMRVESGLSAADSISSHLKSAPDRWLYHAACTMADRIASRQKTWRRKMK
ncbi:MAG TPA: DUF2252 family protein [Leptospiraceae bacterium]|nr:DUF2252 domain-containing protein [Leptospirales bacterium]HMU82249.1 DUF2252 family protein [Leptospiraceae bacterium]HMW60727.1 DUF2252 family protein [Leptospiraceae bacterium]HMX56509.1 DUF2252 family protein [Leptospiraceae bacterium]HMY43854.1 DUF2252 family protein [Leptospiraceae bacterium]